MKKMFFTSSLMWSLTLFAQDKAEQALKIFEEKYPQEKIHLLFDKKSYVAGENLWFKSFIYTGYEPTSISTSLFVELYDNNKTLLDKKMIPLLNGEGNGSFALPENMKENVYYIRAYTTWSTNFSEEFQAIRSVEIYNPSSSEKLTIDNSSEWNVSVHPESGTFIDQINTKFAVRLHSKGQKPSNWNGYITELSHPDAKLATFKGFDENIGSFRLAPELGKKYQLTIEDDKGKKQTVNLPDVISSGINLQMESNPEVIKYSLVSKNMEPESKYTIIGTINDQIVYKAKLSISDKIYTIPTEKLVNGILQLSIFNEKEDLLLQRMCFIQPKNLQVKKAELSKISLKETPRSQNTFNISSSIDSPNYTVLVLNEGSKSTEDENSFISTLLLTGDISSDLDSPAQYFKKDSNSEALDAILISEKWKRYDWKMLMAGNYPMIKNKTEPYISYKGKVTVSGKPSSNTDLNLIFSMPDNGTKFFQVKTDQSGFFSLNGLMFEDSIKFSYQLNDPKILKEQVQVIFQPNYSYIPLRKSLPQSYYILQPRTPEDKASPEIIKYTEAKNMYKVINEKATLIEEVKIIKQKKNLTKKLNDELSSLTFRNSNEVIFDFVNDINAGSYMNILDYLQGRVAGLQMQKRGFDVTATFRGAPISLFLDEMPASPSQISSLPSSDVAMVKVIRGYFAGGTGGNTNGAIAIYTKRGGISGSIENSSKPTDLKQITLKGYDKEIAFSNPDYSNENFKNISIDTRTVLYWNPFLEVQPKEPVKVEFYNNDEAKNYRVIIIGYDTNSFLPIYYDNVLKQ
ncbi:hypothetical protein [Chryseobacterium taiwanense]|nr:hypothetical protein [Chryseobacterium taiwanense]